MFANMRIECELWFMSLVIVYFSVTGYQLPGSCISGQYLDPNTLTCRFCPANVSMVTSPDGFGCTCKEHSVPMNATHCKPCNVTEVVAADGTVCVPRHCQNSSGRVACRKCPNDYISATQNLDGSVMKEVQCIRCAHGYKAQNNACVRCESCRCASREVVVRYVKCLPRKYVMERPKYDYTAMHPNELLDIVKHEYLCSERDVRSCRTLANMCVKNFYSPDLAGPCRFWVQPNITRPKDLPHIAIEPATEPITLTRGKNTLLLVAAVHTSSGGVQLLQDLQNRFISPCFLPIQIIIGNDMSFDCQMNISQLSLSNVNETLSPYLLTGADLKSLPVTIRKPNGHYIEKAAWSTNKFKRYFLLHNCLSTTTNGTNTVYLQTLTISLRIDREKSKSGNLKVQISIEAQYTAKSSFSEIVTVSLIVNNNLPDAGIHRGLEVLGSVLGALFVFYSVIQWRGNVRRGGLHVSLFPFLAGSIADSLYFATLLCALHALAAEAGTLGLTLPLSSSEEYMINVLLYSALALKVVKVAWINWRQIQTDMVIIDWSQYNNLLQEPCVPDELDSWRMAVVAREWSCMQTRRRTNLGLTVTLAILILRLLQPWQSQLPKGQGYVWVVATVSWWSSYAFVLISHWMSYRLLGSPADVLPKVCSGAGLSLLVFQEERYAHYVHGRTVLDFADSKSLAGPLSVCRVLCSPQLVTIYTQLSTAGLEIPGGNDTRQLLLTKFLAAFLERALDGLSWVASERTVLERLLDVELVTREAGNTSALLYDPGYNSASCFTCTWWGEEWSLATFDAMFFGCLVIVSHDTWLAALLTMVAWQVAKFIRQWIGNRNLKRKVNNDLFS